MRRKAGELEAARGLFEKALAQYPAFEQAQVGLSRTLIALGRPADALPHLKAALEAEPRQRAWPTITSRSAQPGPAAIPRSRNRRSRSSTATRTHHRAIAPPRCPGRSSDVTPQALDPDTPR